VTVTRRLAAAFASAITLLALGAFAVLPVAAADTTAPAIAKAVMRDVDADGKADGVVVYYREPVYHLSDTDRVYPFKVSGYTVRSVGPATGGRYVIVNLVEKATADYTARPTVSYTRTTLAGKPVRDAARNQAPTQSFPWTIPVRAVFVSPAGNDANAGTQAAPKKTINNAIARSLAIGARDIYVATGIYNETLGIQLATNRNIWGRYVAGSWYRATSGSTTVNGSPQGALADHDTGAWLRDLVITGSPSLTSPTAYGLRLLNGSSVAIERVALRATNGSAGADGANGTEGAAGLVGVPGGGGTCDGSTPGQGGAGGLGSGGPANAGGRGGNGGPEGDNNGQAGTTGSGSLAGIGGAAGSGGSTGGPGGNGGRGEDAPANAGGAGGKATVFAATSTVSGDPGGPGLHGFSGPGGGGGGGGGGQGCFYCNDGSGNGGGGGGGGGAGGEQGTGGMAGGASVGAYVVSSTLTARSSSITAGNGGPGGRGGDGAYGGIGAAGGLGGSVCTGEVGRGGNGGRGGYGGRGGGGGGGAGGASVGVFLKGTTAAFSQTSSTVTPGTAGAGGGGGYVNSSAGENGIAATSYQVP
jgi:hypothetical protein